ncbi:radical SAM protein [Cohnella sp. CFH 77786]|uniref:SPL family radical SAM protein n=1 Tax=Cohnella sp. CFH 77786 TaxID=2662265 RepID=UPI001C60CC00|nr:radical SAM protein [Cohnella sp. CFH 77786]MBW5447464.1 radical SAM protein [Cohnella sp. CFH 77786]
MNPIRYEPIRPKTVLNPVKAASMPFDWSINPYRGCQHGCSFCYARSTHAFIGETADDAFRNHVFWKQDAPDVLRGQLKKMAGRLPPYVAVGTATDPYQQLEGKARLTRGCLEALAEYGVPASITTRSPLVLRDLDLLQLMPGSTVNISIHTLDPDIWRTFEPSTPAPRLRLDTVRKLNEAGIQAGVFIAPILPYISDDESSIEALLAECAKVRAAFVMPSFLRLSTSEVKSWFFQTLRQHYPHLTETYGRLYWGSGYVPDSYKQPMRERIRRQLAASGLSAHEPVGKGNRENQGNRTSNPPEPSIGPVQLTLF